MLSSSNKIAIIGAGSVGAAIANSLLLGKVVADIILVDIDPAICHAQVQDLSDAEFLSNVRIKQGHHQDAGQCDIIIITAGAKQKPGDTRLDLISRNTKMLEQVLDAMRPIRTDAILVLVANPVDILTHFAQQLSGLPKSQVFGSGTFLDSVRLRGLLANRLKVGAFSSVVTEPITNCSLGSGYRRPRLRLRGAWRFSICECQTIVLICFVPTADSSP